MKRIFALLLVLTLLLGLCACAPQEETVSEEITFVLDWTPNTNHTGLYVALEKGWFREAGIDTVTVVQPPENGAEVLVASGGAQFGVSFQDSMAPALAQDLPITAVAAVIQHNTSGIISRAGEGMDSPKGLEGKKYATWDMAVEKATIESVMKSDGGDFSKVQMIPSTVTDEVSALRSNSVDAIWVFYAWAGIACETAGLDTDYFAFADIDPAFDFYTPVIIADNDFLAAKPETAKAFLSALSRGYEFAMENPREAADILMKHAPELQANAELVYASQEYLATRYQDDAARWGEINAERWGAYFSWLNAEGLTEKPLDVTVGFTNNYLP